MCSELGALSTSQPRQDPVGSHPFLSSESASALNREMLTSHCFVSSTISENHVLCVVSKPKGKGSLGLHVSLSFITGVRQNMAPSVNTAKELSIFLVKAMFAFLEAAIFALIPKPLKNVAGEIVLITGAGSGLGRLLAVQFAHLGSVLVLWDINEEGNEETRRMAWDAGAMTVHAYTCDCGRKEEVYRVANQVHLGVLPVSSGEKAHTSTYISFFVCLPLSTSL